MVYEDTYICLACGKRGKTENLLREISGGSVIIKEHKKSRNPWTKWTRNASLMEACKLANRNLPSEYLERRGIPPEYQCKYKLGYRDNWYTFPIFDQNNRLIGATARRGEGSNHPAKYINPSGQNPDLLYIPDWELFENKPIIFLTFGILDALSICSLGYAGMSTTTGKKPNPSAFDFIRKRIVVIPDKGEEIEGHTLVSKLGWRGVLAEIPNVWEVKDINELFMKTKKTLEIWLCLKTQIE